MNKQGANLSDHGSFFRVLIIGLTFSLLTGNAAAETGWWQKGINLLKNLGGSDQQAELTVKEIGAGLKEALRVGTENVSKGLGRLDGFNLDPAIHIPLPEKLQTVKSVLGKIGMANLADDLELKLNRAAEKATPKAKELFFKAIGDMTIDDVKGIYQGPEDSATRYLEEKMSPALANEMRPVVAESLSQVGTIQAYDAMMGQYRTLPFVPDIKADLTEYVVKKGMDGIFYYLAIEEADIRKNPAKRTTELLQRVFGKQ
jgi:hypothetical protein